MSRYMKFHLSGTHRGLDYVVLSNLMGFRCGYVKIPEGHVYHGKHYMDEVYDQVVSVHGGLTFSEKIEQGDHEYLSPGFWIGFDCGHGFDEPDPDEMSREYMKLYTIMKKICSNEFFKETWRHNHIRNDEYVENECKKLCDQIMDVHDMESSMRASMKGEQHE